MYDFAADLNCEHDGRRELWAQSLSPAMILSAGHLNFASSASTYNIQYIASASGTMPRLRSAQLSDPFPLTLSGWTTGGIKTADGLFIPRVRLPVRAGRSRERGLKRRNWICLLNGLKRREGDE